MKKLCVFMGALFLALVIMCTMTYKKVQVVRVPVSIHLDEDKYKILRTDTIADTIQVIVGDTVAKMPVLTLRYFYMEKK
jgi:hypothetical protein